MELVAHGGMIFYSAHTDTGRHTHTITPHSCMHTKCKEELPLPIPL